MKCKLCPKHRSKSSRTGLCSGCGNRRLSELFKDKTIEISVKRIFGSHRMENAQLGVAQ